VRSNLAELRPDGVPLAAEANCNAGILADGVAMGRSPRSSGDQSASVLRKASQVRVLPRAPLFDLPLRGPKGEPINLLRTLTSHGLASLPPMHVDESTCTLEVTVPIPGARPRTVRVTSATADTARVTVLGRPPSDGVLARVRQAVTHILRLDEDLSPFYAMAAADPDLTWAAAGAGRMLRGSTVFEDVIKTICTTNCAWSATERMVGALVSHLGEPAPSAPATGPAGRAFPTPEAMAAASEAFYRDTVRAGYRGAYLKKLAKSVAAGTIDLEALGRATVDDLPDDELAARLLALPGVGPYAAAHIMMMIGRHSRLILDSWTRPTYARIANRKRASDGAMKWRFRRYGRYAGLAFWLYLTRDWVRE
jgi:3-methyladenine DNA glycosylase/8-oxoguanine DNA glycosylase